MRTVVLDPEADRDISDEFNYLADRNLQAALRFLQAAEDTFSDLSEMPGTGSPREFKNHKLTGVRMFPTTGFPNYLIFYLTTNVSILILRVLHGAQH